DGLFRFSPSKKELLRYKNDVRDSTSISQDKIVSICEDDQGDIWVGTDNQGISVFSKRTKEFSHYRASAGSGSISGNSIQKIIKDSYGYIWIGTLENGIDRYDQQTGDFKNFPPDGENNLLYHIQDISEYKAGQLM